jgi:tetratricopeptide (TPR) repeat protein
MFKQLKDFPKVVLAASLLGWSNQALALSCDEIINMVGYNIQTDIILGTMKSSGTRFTADDIQCLQSKGAPAGVIEQAKKMSEASKPAVEELPDDESLRPGIDDDDVDMRSKRGGGEDLSEDDTGNDPSEIKQAIKLLRAKKPLTASYQLFRLLDEGKYPEHESKIHYYLARALTDLGLYHSAQHYYLQVIKKGPGDSYFNYALPKMVAISHFTSDDSDLARIAAKLPPSRYPRQAKNHLYYLLGVKNYNDGELAASRESFGKVSSKSSFYLQSRYVEGVIFNEQEKYKSAVRAFRDVYKEEIDVYDDPKELTKVNNLKDLSLINIASIYYGIERYDEASNYYQKVDRGSDYWGDSLFRDAWANFMMGQLNVSLGKILTVESPYFVETDFLPEATILKALTYFNLCEYDLVESIIGGFDANYTPMKNEIGDFLSDYETKEQRKLADQAWNRYFGKKTDGQTLLPQSFFARVLRNKDLDGIATHLEIMNEEINLIDSQKPQWRDTIGNHLKKILEKDRSFYEKRAGRLFIAEMQRQHKILLELLSQSQIVGFEVVDAQRLDYEYKASNLEVLGDQSKFDIDFATSADFIYWPFNGEFWADELGYYNYTEQGSCK